MPCEPSANLRAPQYCPLWKKRLSLQHWAGSQVDTKIEISMPTAGSQAEIKRLVPKGQAISSWTNHLSLCKNLKAYRAPRAVVCTTCLDGNNIVCSQPTWWVGFTLELTIVTFYVGSTNFPPVRSLTNSHKTWWLHNGIVWQCTINISGSTGTLEAYQ